MIQGIHDIIFYLILSKFEANSITKPTGSLPHVAAKVVKHTFTVDEAQTMDKGEWTKAKLGQQSWLSELTASGSTMRRKLCHVHMVSDP